jgi:hypothetical protein
LLAADVAILPGFFQGAVRRPHGEVEALLHEVVGFKGVDTNGRSDLLDGHRPTRTDRVAVLCHACQSNTPCGRFNGWQNPLRVFFASRARQVTHVVLSSRRLMENG